MDCSPHREVGGIMHLSPTHHFQCSPLDGLVSISSDHIRRSLSRSPSKPRPRLSPQTNSPNSPHSPISPLATRRAYNPKHPTETPRNVSYPTSPLAQHAATPQPSVTSTTTTKKKVRRAAPFLRSSPRYSPARQVLADSLNQGNSAPLRRNYGEEITQSRFALMDEKLQTEPKMPKRDAINDEPIAFPMGAGKLSYSSENFRPSIAKSSPLKRSDGVMNLSEVTSNSPSAKRRSLHGSSSLGVDFDTFNNHIASDPAGTADFTQENNYVFGATPRRSPPRRAPSHRRSRPTFNTAPTRTKQNEFTIPGEAAKSRNRMSLDGKHGTLNTQQQPFVTTSSPNPFSRSSQFGIASNPQQPLLSFGASMSRVAQRPHPLSHALTPSSSTSSLAEDSPTHMPPPVMKKHTLFQRMHGVDPEPQSMNFAASLPIGAALPTDADDQNGDTSVFGTPAAKVPKPNALPFMSTCGMKQKQWRPDQSLGESYVMPETPSKPFHVPSAPLRSRPTRPGSFLGHMATTFPELDMTPVKANGLFDFDGSNVSQFSLESTPRRRSTTNTEGDISGSPRGLMDSQSSADELPPTPTKNGSHKQKKTSLRSNLFNRRGSLKDDTFEPPAADEAQSPSKARTTTPILGNTHEHSSPHTPLGDPPCTVPDPSSLSISGHQRQTSFGFGSSTDSNVAVTPATPTANRGSHSFFGSSFLGQVHGVTKNDVDSEITSRFKHVISCGQGVFSEVYRVEDPTISSAQPTSPSAASARVWAVKKSKKPFSGPGQRKRQYREVEILRALRGAEHIVQYANCWEANAHFYIQTEFCENGNLADFLLKRGSNRLDDFRIWKILNELALGVKAIHSAGFMHLDIKPSNILIDFEGTLKIADFGLASICPARHSVEEGDRAYMAPEQLRGQHDQAADIFALGVTLLELGTHYDPPQNGETWTQLREGSLHSVPSLTMSSDSLVSHDELGMPIVDDFSRIAMGQSVGVANAADGSMVFADEMTRAVRADEKVQPPHFVVDRTDSESLDSTCQWLITADPSRRPKVDDIFERQGVQWVRQRRRAGATVFEGNYGPAEEVLTSPVDTEMPDA